MKTLVVMGAIALAFVSGHAAADCGGTGWKKMNATGGTGGILALSTLGGKTVCVGAAPTWDAQEFHSGTTSGDLIDYKRGPGHPVDPTQKVGTWSIVGDQINYNYGSGGNYTYDVYEKNGAYSFCVGASEKAAATLRTGQVGC